MDDDIAALPPALRDIALVAGFPAALALGSHKVGRIYIPARDRLSPDHWLVGLVGADAAAAISDRWGGCPLDIPSALVGQARRRREAIARLTSDGASLNDIARALGIDRRTASRNRSKRRLPPKPLPLFEGR